MKISLDMNEVEIGEWEETIGGIVEEELRLAIKKEVKAQLSGDKRLVKIIWARMQKVLENL